MSSTSSISRSRALAVLAVLLLWVGNAHADRKRIAVLEFDGPNAEKLHAGVVKLLKKTHTVVSVNKWNTKAEELGATKVTEKNVKKVANKLKLDGVVTGKIDKRRGQYIIKLKLRSGATGEILGSSIQTKTDGSKLDAQAQRDLKDELVSAINDLESNRDGGGDDEEEEEVVEEEKPKKSGFARKNAEDETVAKEEEKKKADKKRKADEEKAALATKKQKDDEAAAEEEEKSDEEEKKARKRKASLEDDSGDEDGEEDGVEESVEVDDTDKALKVSPGRRAIDATLGLSFTARRLNFKYASDLGKPPPGYKQSVPVAGALVDMTFYPMAFGKPKGIISGIGLEILYDQVLKINSQKKFADGNGMQQVADLATSESRWQVGAVLRYPLGQHARAIVVGGKLLYGRQKFNVEQTIPNSGTPPQKTDIPNVHYTMVSPTAFVQAPITSKIILNAEASFHAVTNTGAIQNPDQYGAATVTGYELNVGADYMLMTNVFIRAGIRYEGIGFTFKGDPMSMTHTRDTDATDQDVTGAKDTYFGGAATVGYLY